MYTEIKLCGRYSCRTSYEGVSRSVSVHNIVLVDVQNGEHGHLLTWGSRQRRAVN